MTPEERLDLLVEAERTQAPTRARMERGFDRLQQALGAQVPPIDIGPVDPTLLAGSSALGKLVALPWVAKVTAIVGVVASAGALAGSYAGTESAATRPPPALASAAPEPAATTAGSERAARSGTQGAPDAESTLRAPPAVPPRRAATAGPLPVEAATDSLDSPSSTRSQPPPGLREPSVKAFDDVPPNGGAPAPAFDAELVLIKRAKAEFDAGREQHARAWLSEHARRFPGGVFAAEREGLLVLSACRANPAAGGAGARAFLQRYPRSPLAERVRGSCGLE